MESTLSLIMQSWPLLVKATATTIILGTLSCSIGVIGGMALGLLTCKKLWHPIISPLCKAYVLLIRGLPLYLQLLIVYYVLPSVIGLNLSAFAAGVITLGFNSIAYCAETIRSSMNAIAQGQWDACTVLGYTKKQALTGVIVPQMFKAALAPLTNELIVLIKESSIVSVIGLLELTKVGSNLSAKTLDPLTVYGVIALLYLVITTTLSLLSYRLEKAIAHD
jgi:His/Glu/Gln/Arg/opine family amino acid ABC transporter permease subunit